jgi:lambda repressor-like predicted transcriptional regulator
MYALLIATAITSNINDSIYTSAVAEQVWFCPGTSIVNLSSKETISKSSLITAFEIVTWLRDEGLPIAAIAEIARVERKSVYAWINGGPIRPQNQDRLEKIYNLLSESKQTELIHLYRFWNRQLTSGVSLATLLKEELLNQHAIKNALSELWPMAVRVKKMTPTDRQNQGKKNPFLEEIGEVINPDEP